MQHQGTVELQTDRLVLRRIRVDDSLAAFNNWTSDDKVTEYLTWAPHKSVEETKGIFKGWVDNYAKDDFYLWAIVPKSNSDKPIGTIAVVRQNEEYDMLCIGYCIGSAWWHKGIMSEAFAGVIAFLFDKVKANRIESYHDPRNPNSGKVMIKCGLQYEGTLRQADRNNKGLVDACMYSLLAEDYYRSKSSENCQFLVQEYHSDCAFCNICNHSNLGNIVYESNSVIAIMDIDPITEGHILILPKLHVDTILKIPPVMIEEMLRLVQRIIPIYKVLYGTASYTMVQNGGDCCDFGHFHLHVFPRYTDDGVELKSKCDAQLHDIKSVADKIKALLNQ